MARPHLTKELFQLRLLSAGTVEANRRAGGMTPDWRRGPAIRGADRRAALYIVGYRSDVIG